MIFGGKPSKGEEKMKKTLFTLAIILIIVPATLSAGLIDFSVGATAQYKSPFDASEEISLEDGMADFENYALGADIRTRILFAEVDVTALYEQVEVDDVMTHAASGLVTGGLSLDFLGLARIGLGLGPRVTAIYPEGGEVSFVDSEGDELTAENLAEALMQSPLTWRATADLNLGGILVGLNYTVDSNGFTLEGSDFAKLLPGDSDWNEGRIGASVLITLF